MVKINFRNDIRNKNGIKSVIRVMIYNYSPQTRSGLTQVKKYLYSPVPNPDEPELKIARILQYDFFAIKCRRSASGEHKNNP
jgi:hypothetical protein